MNRKLIRYLAAVFAVFAVITAINPPAGYGTENLIPLWGPFEWIRNLNRWICMGLGVAITAAAVGLSGRMRRQPTPAGAWILLGIHLVIFAKNFYIGPLQAALLLIGFVTMIAAVVSFSQVRVASASGPQAIWEPVIWASIGFLAANAVQYFINPAATMIVGGRFHGITSNPQMYALSTAIMAPALLFEFNHRKRTLPRWVVLGAFLVLVFFVIKTGSRLSMLLTAFSVLMFYRARVDRLAVFLIPAVIIGMIWGGALEEAPLTEDVRVLSFDNTRGHVWSGLWQTFLDNPLTGVELRDGERVGFGENSFLGAGSALGVVGLTLAVAVAVWVGGVILALVEVERRRGWRPETALPVAILSACLVGAFFEASLMGIFTFPLTAMLYTAFAAEGLRGRLRGKRDLAKGRRLRLALRSTGSKDSRRGQDVIGIV